MGSAASNQNRVASAGISRNDHGNSEASWDQNKNRSQNSPPAHLNYEQNNELKQKKKASLPKTEVLPFSPKDSEDEKENSSSSNNRQIKKIHELELQLAKSESQKLDLLQQVNGIKQSSLSSKPASTLPPLEERGHFLHESETIKDQRIMKLEKDLQVTQKEAACMRQKLKKRIKALTNQLHEVRQEGSINQMELNAVISQQNELIESLKSDLKASPLKRGNTDQDEDTGHSKIIVELSNQLSEQAEQIASLESKLSAKDKKIRELEEKSKTLQPVAFDTTTVSTDRLPSGRGKRSHKNMGNSTVSRGSAQFNRHNPSSSVGTGEIPTVFERQSTALSDSDSDWELESVPSKVHSAPAGARIKSAVSGSSSVTKEDLADNVQGNDDSILDTKVNPGKSRESDDNNPCSRTRPFKKSALKTHLEKKKNVNQTNALIGPSLAFAKSKEPPSDTSCEPTPRCADRSHLPGFKSLHIVNSVSH
ncbi:Cap-gly domain-containing linker protein 1-like [Plakobranchus ocellatus]|uniref:Cap-gly domain-containing linker protein 1-like n=1 Tax=Plakobranchus ocellatus TaxID=259542 RepID=A0AAV3XSR4_9GAST|nr:Cap-gly domain-containing linker protein 1-like [Plakobranchus ocellatus]